mgnify:CR=1 FL=1
MRGYLQAALKMTQSDAQKEFAGLSRARRVKLASIAQTTLLKADQWGRGETVATDVASGLEKAVLGRKKKK